MVQSICRTVFMVQLVLKIFLREQTKINVQGVFFWE